MRSIAKAGYVDATDIQQQCIPLILNKKDLIGQSQTGTGKTAAFVIPIIEHLIHSDHKKTKALIVCPTRELAIQITQHIRVFTNNIDNVKTVTVYGGQSISHQILDLKKGADIIVGTPGRIMDHMRRKTIRLDALEHIVLDEADEMLQMGFKEDIETIMDQLPTSRHTCLFSATMPQAILDIANTYLEDPRHINILSTDTSKRSIEQMAYEVAPSHKADLLIQLLALHQPKQAMIFCNTKKMVDDLMILVQKAGFDVVSLHGDMRQEMRTAIMSKFKNQHVRLLIATDVAARGIDVDALDIVFNYDLPQDNEYYIHRIGRTGRAGLEGKAITLITQRETRSFRALMASHGFDVAYMELPTQKELDRIASDTIRKLIEKDTPVPMTVADMAKELLNSYDAHTIIGTLLAHIQQGPDLKAIASPSKKQNKQYNTYTINIGTKQGFNPKKLVQTTFKLCGIHHRHIGNISIHASKTTIDIASHIPIHDMKKLKNMNLKKPVHVELITK